MVVGRTQLNPMTIGIRKLKHLTGAHSSQGTQLTIFQKGTVCRLPPAGIRHFILRSPSISPPGPRRALQLVTYGNKQKQNDYFKLNSAQVSFTGLLEMPRRQVSYMHQAGDVLVTASGKERSSF